MSVWEQVATYGTYGTAGLTIGGILGKIWGDYTQEELWGLIIGLCLGLLGALLFAYLAQPYSGLRCYQAVWWASLVMIAFMAFTHWYLDGNNITTFFVLILLSLLPLVFHLGFIAAHGPMSGATHKKVT